MANVGRFLRETNMDTECTLTIKMKDGTVREWSIGAVYGFDNDRTLRAHVSRWIPGAELVSFKFWNPHCECDLRDTPDAPAEWHAIECPSFRPAPNPACNRPAASGASGNDITSAAGG